MTTRTRRGAAPALSATLSLPATAPILSIFLCRRPVGVQDMTEATTGAIATSAFQKVFTHVQVWTLRAIATVAFVVICANLLLRHRQQNRCFIPHSGSFSFTVLNLVPSARPHDSLVFLGNNTNAVQIT